MLSNTVTMTWTSGLRDLLRSEYTRGASPGELTRAVTKMYSDRELVLIAKELILDEARALIREETRKIEAQNTLASYKVKPKVDPGKRPSDYPHGQGGYAGNRELRRNGAKCGCDICVAALQEDYAITERASAKMWETIGVAIQEVTDRIRLTLTDELLQSKFALGDGTEVTWGDATVADHQKRIDLLKKNAFGSMETAARHEAAIRQIGEAGANTLAEVKE